MPAHTFGIVGAEGGIGGAEGGGESEPSLITLGASSISAIVVLGEMHSPLAKSVHPPMGAPKAQDLRQSMGPKG